MNLDQLILSTLKTPFIKRDNMHMRRRFTTHLNTFKMERKILNLEEQNYRIEGGLPTLWNVSGTTGLSWQRR